MAFLSKIQEKVAKSDGMPQKYASSAPFSLFSPVFAIAANGEEAENCGF